MNTSNETSVYSIVDILIITRTSVSLVLGVPINSCVLWLVLTGPAGTMASEIFTLNVCVSEILSSLFSFLFLFIQKQPLLYLTLSFLLTGRPVFQTCICLERFVAVVHPVLFLKYKPLRYRVACSVLAWLAFVGLSLLHVLLFSFTEIAHYFYLGQCLVLVSVMLLCSLAILRVLKQPMPGEMGRERDNSMKRRAFIIICLIMVSFLATYFIWGIITVAIHFSRGFSFVLFRSIWLAITVLTGLVQPLLYLCQKPGKLPCIRALRWIIQNRKPETQPETVRVQNLNSFTA